MRGLNKRGQVAIFVIIALVIVGIILVVFLYPNISLQISEPFTPENYLRSCIEPELRPALEKISSQGGYMNPEGFFVVDNVKVKYLCYTSEFYKTCQVQQPLIKKHVEDELYSSIKLRLDGCFSQLKQEYERQGYSVSVGESNSKIEIVPNKIKINIDAPITVTKESSQTYKGFEFSIDSQMYDLLSITSSIVDFESTYGDSETTLYMQYYPNLRIDKTKLSDGTKIYIVSDVVTKESFRFASRSLSWPPGYE